jgi:hypothetical protein
LQETGSEQRFRELKKISAPFGAQILLPSSEWVARPLTASQRACAAVNAEQLVNRLKKEAKERQLSTLKQNETVKEIIPDREKMQSRDILTKRFRVNSRYVLYSSAKSSLGNAREVFASSLDNVSLFQVIEGYFLCVFEVLSGKNQIPFWFLGFYVASDGLPPIAFLDVEQFNPSASFGSMAVNFEG